MKKPPYSEEQLKYLGLKAAHLFEDKSKQLVESQKREEHDLVRRGLSRSGMWFASKRKWLIERYRLRLESLIEAHVELWEMEKDALDGHHLTSLQEELKKFENHKSCAEALREELVRVGNREEHSKAIIEGLERELSICDAEADRKAELLFFERRGIKGRKIKIFISSDQDELEAERAALKNKIESKFPNQFEIFLFERETPDSRTPGEFFKDNVISSDVYIGFFKGAYSAATIEEFDAAKKHGCETWLYFNIRAGNVEESNLKEFKDRVKERVSYSEWARIRDLEDSIVERLQKYHQGKGVKRKVVEKLVDLKWADEAEEVKEWRKRSYELRWAKEETVERRLNAGWVYLTSQDNDEEIEFRYVTKDRLILLAKKAT